MPFHAARSSSDDASDVTVYTTDLLTLSQRVESHQHYEREVYNIFGRRTHVVVGAFIGKYYSEVLYSYHEQLLMTFLKKTDNNLFSSPPS
jgi:hypothetical protein